MTQSASHGDFACSVDLSATDLNTDAAANASDSSKGAAANDGAEMFTTVIESASDTKNNTEACLLYTSDAAYE